MYCIASEGDVQEGVTAEASALAGHQELGNLIVLWDRNHISIEEDTDVAFTEDVPARYRAYGWDVQRVDWIKTGNYVEDVQELYNAIERAKTVTDKPSFIEVRTIIGYPAPNKQNTGSVHGSKLGAEEIVETKKVLGFDPEKSFFIEDEVLAHTRELRERGLLRIRSGMKNLRHGLRLTPSGQSCTTAWCQAKCQLIIRLLSLSLSRVLH